MSLDRIEFLAACTEAYDDPQRRNAVEAALGKLKRIRVTDAIEDYTRLLIKKRERRQGANPSGRNSHAQNVRLVLLKIMRTLNAPEGVTYLDELTLGRVSTYLDTSDGSPKTLRGHKSCIDGLIRFCRQKEWLSTDPLEILDSPELRHEAIQWVRREDFPRVLEALEGHPAQLPVALAGLAGIRRCEIIRLAPRDWFGRTDRHIRIRPEVSKVNRERKVPVSPELEAIINRLGQRFGPALCIGPRKRKAWHPMSLTKLAKKALLEARIKTTTDGILADGPMLVDAGVFNTLRHGSITYWLEDGKDMGRVAKWAGNSVLVIEKHYAGSTTKPEDADAATFQTRQAN